MKKISFIGAVSVGLLGTGLAVASPSDAVGQIRQGTIQVLPTLKGSDADGARRKVEAYVLPYFNSQRMTALAVDNLWRQVTDIQKQALTRKLQTLLIRAYSGMIFQLRNVKVNIRDNSVVNKGGREVVVRAKVSDLGEKPINMDFSAYQSDSRYRVYNMTVEGASLVTVYRGQFNETVKSKGINGPIDKLKTKNSGKTSKS